MSLMALAVAAACDRAIDCTLIGCESGLTVVIDNAPPGPFTVQGTAAGAAGVVRTGGCPDTSGCTGTVFLPAFTPGRAQLTVTTSAGTRQHEVTPAYATTRPNGPRCGPTCRNATVRVAWQ
jgi:hypothetical protein